MLKEKKIQQRQKKGVQKIQGREKKNKKRKNFGERDRERKNVV